MATAFSSAASCGEMKSPSEAQGRGANTYRDSAAAPLPGTCFFLFLLRKGQLNRHTRYRPATTTRCRSRRSVDCVSRVPTGVETPY